MPKERCDLENGACAAPSLDEAPMPVEADKSGWELIYVGDPMCSWCWGVAPVVSLLPEYCREAGGRFSIVAGGLRPGGGDVWDTRFKTFLRRHWEEIGKITGQPFHFGILDRENFDYDTEPVCRAVVTARTLLEPLKDKERRLAEFFACLQNKFYVQNDDPMDLNFYRDCSARAGLNVEAFISHFTSRMARDATMLDFRLNRSWGVRGYPSFVLRRGDKVGVLTSGYVDIHKLDSLITLAISGDC